MANGVSVEFWKGRRNDELLELARAYGLRVIEIRHLKRSLVGEPTENDLPKSIAEFLETLAEAVRSYFQRDCPENGRRRFETILHDEEQKGNLRYLWELVRQRISEIKVSAAPDRFIRPRG